MQTRVTHSFNNSFSFIIIIIVVELISTQIITMNVIQFSLSLSFFFLVEFIYLISTFDRCDEKERKMLWYWQCNRVVVEKWWLVDIWMGDELSGWYMPRYKIYNWLIVWFCCTSKWWISVGGWRSECRMWKGNGSKVFMS